jgi:hypothetical protein
MSSQAVWAPVTGGPGSLLVSPFNMKWRFSAPAGGVEGSKLCLFSVIMPAKCVSGVSPRFHYRRLAFCFLPLAAILEFLSQYFLRAIIYCRLKAAEVGTLTHCWKGQYFCNTSNSKVTICDKTVEFKTFDLLIALPGICPKDRIEKLKDLSKE